VSLSLVSVGVYRVQRIFYNTAILGPLRVAEYELFKESKQEFDGILFAAQAWEGALLIRLLRGESPDNSGASI
jgi:hypothetical protein